mmetsp:Transcript_16394/g.39314  ORF Transcript_16394/g.39314 Transcript_16394/m.39314 type:complete len:420 (-) Transcript_16394:1232-2491(-)
MIQAWTTSCLSRNGGGDQRSELMNLCDVFQSDEDHYGKGLMLKTNTDELYVITAAHVAIGATKVMTDIGNKEQEMAVKMAWMHEGYLADGHPDLALLRIEHNDIVRAALRAKPLIAADNVNLRHELCSVDKQRFFKGEITEIRSEAPSCVATAAAAGSTAGAVGPTAGAPTAGSDPRRMLWLLLSGITSMPGDSGSPMVTADGYLGGVVHGVSPQTSKSKRHMSSTTNSLTRRALHPLLYIAPLDSLRSPSESFVAVPLPEGDTTHLYKALELLELMPHTFSIKKNPMMTIAGYKTSYVTPAESQLQEGDEADEPWMKALNRLEIRLSKQISRVSEQINSMRGYEKGEMATEASFKSLREHLMQHFDIAEADIDSMTVTDLFMKLFNELEKDPFPEWVMLQLQFSKAAHVPPPKLRHGG